MTEQPPICLLGYDPAKRSPKDNPAHCTPEGCQHCGWNPAEAERRKAMPLTRHPDGLKGLVIENRKEGTA